MHLTTDQTTLVIAGFVIVLAFVAYLQHRDLSAFRQATIKQLESEQNRNAAEREFVKTALPVQEVINLMTQLGLGAVNAGYIEAGGVLDETIKFLEDVTTHDEEGSDSLGS